MSNIHILLVEDDYDFGSILKQYLEVHDYQVTWVTRAQEALSVLKQSEKMPVSIAVLDVMMPEMDGFQLAEKILLDSPEIPFVFLTARKLKEDKLKGLRLGADDYIVKPFDADILVLKLRNILKRSQKQVSAEVHEKILLGSYQLDLKNYYLERNGKIQKITEKEAALMSYLFRHKNRLLKREQILQDLWGNDDFFSGRSMDVFLSRLRKYFKHETRIRIESTRGIGITFYLDE
ncbi:MULTISPECIES: response regulator transcription factor [Mesonia]|uniref:Response regulator SaeR n=1 Tax=Mesonia oceanica TaxID=2687242 RepID=A0AC61Y4S8_9FLAO|nr:MULTISPECIES: response regulator transcription factor [Mesonia]MAN26606.1 DNA-binding response regulator [Mesonia sp.]MAQ40874.1 DNA-binding response regulator [Mesonia sp.]MBJ97795.1 DNA-binding response regulator [Flavobacteriaceae bacterium]VVU99503.1 Response regulator SaeR [Mesonia oceanica]|tara:strand:- start:9462 stop:10163 length:702 start_codon:yes stop_codon:yes gene_type:complete